MEKYSVYIDQGVKAMTVTKDIYTLSHRLLSAGEDIVTVTIIRQNGSAPRNVGTKMLIRRDGSICGTIGGGPLEGRAMELARQVYATGHSITEEFILRSEGHNSRGMICGGEAEIFVSLISAALPANIELYRLLSELEDDYKKALLISKVATGRINANTMLQSLFLEKKLIGAPLSEREQELLIKHDGEHYPRLVESDGVRYLAEALNLPTTAYIFGAGHVSQKIAHLASLVGFRTIVLDDREEFASKDKFPDADEIIVLKDFKECMRDLPVDRYSYLIIVTRGHRYDMTTLSEALKTEACYIGMIGSRKKRDAIYEALRQNGVTDEQLLKVHSPIGLPILAETPEEIAVSIVAELIHTRASGG